MAGIKHGTSMAYKNHGCRCEICIDTHNQQILDFREKARNHFAKTGEFLSAKTTHGSYSAYVTYGCRCELCTEANRKQNKKTLNKIKVGYSKTGHFPKADQHGTKYGYTIGCRCESCSQAHSDYQQKRRDKLRQAFQDTGNFPTKNTKHGSVTAYDVYLCRCELCHAALQKKYRKRAKHK